MYRLTARMEQNLESNLRRYHDLFDGGGCKGWELEELIVKAIQSDTPAQHLPQWVESGHDDKADIVVKVKDENHNLQIKAGQQKVPANRLMLSGYRLGRFGADLAKISQYLNNTNADIISVSYRKIDDDKGRHHIYDLRYLPVVYLHDIHPNEWKERGAQKVQENEHGVEFSLRPSMSWQIWWSIPLELTILGRTIKIP